MPSLKFRLISILSGMLLFSGFLSGQSIPEDFGVWLGASYDHTLSDKWSASLSAQARTRDNSTMLRRVHVRASVTRKFSRFFRVSGGYWCINNLQSNNIWRTRHRMTLDARINIFPKRSILSYRSRIQGDMGGNGYYSLANKTPRVFWRHSLKYSYRLSRKYLPFMAAEARFQFQNAGSPETNGFERLRLIAGTEVKLSKKHSLEIYGLINEPFNRYPAARMFVFGVEYTFSN